MNILIIDDHEIVRDGIKALIEQEYGWHVVYAVDSIGALPSYASFDEVDVAILDISLVNESGFDTLVKIKQQAPFVKCLACTNMSAISAKRSNLEPTAT